MTVDGSDPSGGGGSSDDDDDVLYLRNGVEYAPDGDTSDPSADTSAPAFPVASTADDGSNSLPADLSTLTIWLLDSSGQRMGADPNSDDPLEQQCGAAYRLTLPSGQVFWGYANADGMVTIPYVVASGSGTIEWGLKDDAPGDIPWGNDTEPGADFFLYCEDISFDVGATDDAEASRKLSNLGYDGEIDDQRAAFATDYSASDNDTIDSAHSGGTAVSRAQPDDSSSGSNA